MGDAIQRGRLQGLIAALEAGLVERAPIVRLAFLAALAGEHTLLVGPPDPQTLCASSPSP